MVKQNNTVKKRLTRKQKIRRRQFRIFIVCAGACLVVSFGAFVVIQVGQFVIGHIQAQTEPAKPAKATNQAPKQVVEESIGTVVIDPGHGGYDGGAIGINGVLEKDITLQISLYLKEELEAKKVKVVMTRDSDEISWPADELRDLTARTNISNDSDADLFVSLHLNASLVMNDGSSGTEVYTMMINDTNIALASHIEEQLEALNYTVNRGVKDEADRRLVVLNKNYVPGTLVELGFLSDLDDAKYVSSSKGQRAIAKALSEGIVETLTGLPK